MCVCVCVSVCGHLCSCKCNRLNTCHIISESLGCCMEAEHCCIALDERDSCVLVAARMYYTGQADSELYIRKTTEILASSHLPA